uniref:Uncharacterized protein n=1 Tax=Nelumbo nucifera TaxID=4432 RepID=A0A822XMQ2_NELNU|nr:TPA_asm: hypothetical protein HUJ06_021802 [Nelumbo nucifera]
MDHSPVGRPGSSNSSSASSANLVPEKKLTLFVLRLATLEKSANGVGALAFIRATIVLGGFAIKLGKMDFCSSPLFS